MGEPRTGAACLRAFVGRSRVVMRVLTSCVSSGGRSVPWTGVVSRAARRYAAMPRVLFRLRMRREVNELIQERLRNDGGGGGYGRSRSRSRGGRRDSRRDSRRR